MSITVSLAESDQEVIAAHQFLCVVAGPTLPGRIDPKDSIEEVWRVAHDDFLLTAMDGKALVGVLGIVRAKHWWGKTEFFANRFFFCLPKSRAGKPLLKAAKQIAKECGIELIIISEARGKVSILNPQRPALANSPKISRALAT